MGRKHHQPREERTVVRGIAHVIVVAASSKRKVPARNTSG